jgi:hypothetical protein
MVAESLAGRRFWIRGRLFGLPPRRVAELVAREGGAVTRSPAKATDIVVAHACIRLPDVLATLPAGQPLRSEIGFRRLVGLAPPSEDETRDMSAGDVARLSRLRLDDVALLSVFDVLDPVDGRFGYRDLACAREVSRLRESGVPVEAIADVGARLRRRGSRLCEARLVAAPWGDIVQSVGGHYLGFDDQFLLQLPDERIDIDALVARAEEAEADEDWPEAQRLYERALRLDRDDPLLPFNLGNVLDATGRPSEAERAYLIALERDPGMADAWYNLAILRERRGEAIDAGICYRRALAADPGFRDARYNLALLETRLENWRAALDTVEDWLSGARPGEDVGPARRLAALCRMRLTEQARRAVE